MEGNKGENKGEKGKFRRAKEGGNQGRGIKEVGNQGRRNQGRGN